MRFLVSKFLSVRYGLKPDIRDGIDALGLFLAITLLFCLIQSAYDGIVRRNTLFDESTWWYPLYVWFRALTA